MTLDTILNIISFSTLVAAGGYYLLYLHEELRTHRKQIIRIMEHHLALRDRFEFFMRAGGQKMVRDSMCADWVKTNPLDTKSEGPKPPVTNPHEFRANHNYELDVLGMTPEEVEAQKKADWARVEKHLWPNEDRDTAPALPPFQQAEIPHLPSNNP
jgi:hypothetical protein